MQSGNDWWRGSKGRVEQGRIAETGVAGGLITDQSRDEQGCRGGDQSRGAGSQRQGLSTAASGGSLSLNS